MPLTTVVLVCYKQLCTPQTVLFVCYKHLYCLHATNCTACMLQTTVLPASQKRLFRLHAANHSTACTQQTTALLVCYQQLYCKHFISALPVKPRGGKSHRQKYGSPLVDSPALLYLYGSPLSKVSTELGRTKPLC